jgi:hypothetical protein
LPQQALRFRDPGNLDWWCRRCFLWWLPVWTLKELEDCREHLYDQVSQEQMEKRVEEFGGLVRHVLANPILSFDDIARTLDADQAVDLYNLSAQSSDSEVRHIFAHIEVSQLGAQVKSYR